MRPHSPLPPALPPPYPLPSPRPVSPHATFLETQRAIAILPRKASKPPVLFLSSTSPNCFSHCVAVPKPNKNLL